MRSLLPRLAMTACLCGALRAEEAPGATPPGTGDAVKTASAEVQFEQEMAELKAIARPRTIYQFEFEPIRFDRVVLRDPLDNTRVYHYLAFRLRNRVADSGEALKVKYGRYNEVLDSIVKEYQGTAKEVEAGARLVVTDTDALNEDEQHLGSIAARDQLKVMSRRVGITALVTDEIGTRFRALDPVPGRGPQEDYDFDDRGQDRVNILYQQVHDRIEELLGGRYFNTAEIARLEIPPYDPTQESSFTTEDGLPDGDGMARGEVRGVLIFDRLNPVANRFTIEVHGTCNNMRFSFPEPEEDAPAGKEPVVEDYFKLRVRRRAYVLAIHRQGDEYYRDQDSFIIAEHGYRWTDSFQRLERRRTFALARYFLNNIRLPEEGSRTSEFRYIDVQGQEQKGTAEVPVLVNGEVDGQLRGHYTREREGMAATYDAKLAAAKAKQQGLAERYEGEGAYVEEQRQAWNSLMDRYLKILADRKAALPKVMREPWPKSGPGDG